MIPQIITAAYQTSRPDELDVQEILVKKYYTLLHCRHDLIHHLVNTMLLLPDVFGENDFLKKEFGDLLPDHLSKYSPDIVSLQSNKLLIADVSCSHNREYNYNEKKEKYQPIINFLRGHTDLDIPNFYMIWLLPSWSNLDSMLEDFTHFLSTNGFSYNTLNSSKRSEVQLIYEDMAEDIEIIKRKVPSELLFDTNIIYPESSKIDCEVLEELSSKSFPAYAEIQNEIKRSGLEEVEELFENLVSDPEVVNCLSDTLHDESMFENAFTFVSNLEESYPTGNVKPSIFVPFATYSDEIESYLGDMPLKSNSFNKHVNLRLEQQTTYKFLSFLDSCTEFRNTSTGQFLTKLNKELDIVFRSQGDVNIYNTGLLTGDLERETELNTSYFKYRKEQDTSMSKRTYFKTIMKGELKMRDTLPYAFKNKCIKVSAVGLNTNDWVIKSGTAFKRSHEVREYKSKTTIGKEHENSMQQFMDLLNEPEPRPYKTHPFLGTCVGPDTPTLMKIKEGFLERQREFLSILQNTVAHSFSKHSSNIITQLLHFNELNTSSNTFCVINGGRPNCIHIVRGGSLKRGNDIGQAFFTIFVTDNIKWASSVYGNVRVFKEKMNSKTVYVCQTPWVRLSSTKLSFMKDQYFSTLSTAYDSWTRIRDKSLTRQTLQMIYTFRVCVSLCPSQKVAELLMDTRYIVMAALSTYSNVFELIKEKFQPPYKNCMEKHIVKQLREKCKQIVVHVKQNPPKPNKPGFSSNKRIQTTLGGTITMPSLWAEEVNLSMQGLFDELFVYVHTSKDPSSDYHEQVKAMNTILKFQKQFNSMDPKEQAGLMPYDKLKEWILSGNQIGCDAKTVYWGSKLFSKKYKDLYKGTEFQEACLREPLSELESTKACIPEVTRVVTKQERSRANMDKVIANLGSLFKVNNSLIPSPKKTYFKLDVDMSEDVEMVITRNLRVKVHDALLDWLKRSKGKKNYTIDLALWNILENNMRMIADTCIKAQYGAKREFYVINLGAKGMARVLENSYKSLAKCCKNEMISVPGDRKLEYIQSAVNEITLSSERRQDSIFYTNGDCTKWSACETMASFVAFNSGLEEVFGKEITSFNNTVFSAWANKDIQIPQTILQNLKYLSESTSYITETTTVHSTQNFLQGMFNYASSLKAVAATEFALHMFRKLNPGTFLACTHLEHSDDYSLITRVQDPNSFELFRTYHKLSQKLFGINDSIKKTNVQKHFLEFISLFSFNGQLYYPNIKKTKEVGTNLACTNFKNDVMAISSRVSEAVRLSVPLESAYFLQRVHCASLADAYSLTPGLRNSYGDIVTCFSTPLELFGFPDCLPVLSYIVKGDSEPYRLYNYGTESTKKLYKKLFVLGLLKHETSDLPYLKYSEDLGEFYSPTFSYPTRHNRLKQIKQKLGLTNEDSRLYFNSNLTDTLVKPVDTSRFNKWLEAMYFNKSFSQAYTTVSRATMTLRHSLFSSKPCILPYRSQIVDLDLHEDHVDFLTIKQYISMITNTTEFDKKCVDLDKNPAFKQSICAYGTTVSVAYSLFDTIRIIQDVGTTVHTTVQKGPAPYQTLILENRVQNLLQFLINPSNFYEDRRKFLSETSLYRDIEKLSSEYNLELLKTDMTYARQVMKEIMANTPMNSYGLVFESGDVSILGYILQYMRLGLFANETYRVLPCKKTVIDNQNGSQIRFTRDWKTNTDSFTEVLYQLALIYRTLKLRSEHLVKDLDKLMLYEIPELSVTVGSFLKNMTVPKLVSYKVGENAQKILAFLKLAIHEDGTDMRNYLTGKFFYEVNYLPRHSCPEPFSEWCAIKFQNKVCHAYKFSPGTTRPFIILEMGQSNKVLWFYMYTIAERVFGLINQVSFDLRMMHTYDMHIKPLSKSYNWLLKSLSISRLEPQYFAMKGKVIQQVIEPENANLPVIIQKVNFTHGRLGTKEPINMISLYTIEGLSIYMGRVLMYTLPFGNLICKNMLEVKDASESIHIDNVPFSWIQEGSKMMDYLKSDFTGSFDLHDVKENLPTLWKTFDKPTRQPYHFSKTHKLFNLNIRHSPYDEWIPQGLNTEKMRKFEGVSEPDILDISTKDFDFTPGFDIPKAASIELQTDANVTDNDIQIQTDSRFDTLPETSIGFQIENIDDFMREFGEDTLPSVNLSKKEKTDLTKSPVKTDTVGIELPEISLELSSSEIDLNLGSIEETKEEIDIGFQFESADALMESLNIEMDSSMPKIGTSNCDQNEMEQPNSLNPEGCDIEQKTTSLEIDSEIDLMAQMDMSSFSNIETVEPIAENEVSGNTDVIDEVLNLQISSDIHIIDEASDTAELSIFQDFIVKQSEAPEFTRLHSEAREFISSMEQLTKQNPLEIVRNQLNMSEQVEEDLGELFDTTIVIEEEPNSESSNSDSSGANENPGFFQMVEHPSLLAHGYQFERRAREALLPLNEFLMNLWIKPDLMQILAHVKDFGLLIRLVSGISGNNHKIKFTTKQKAILKSTLYMLQKVIGETVNPYMFDKNKGLTVDGDQFKFWALGAYESKDARTVSLRRNPRLLPVHSVENITSSAAWLKAPLRQRDFDHFIEVTKLDQFEFCKTSKLTILLETLVPKLDLVEVDLIEDYGF
ncbi:RNA-dependent RNA polymerase [Phytophthora condilina negative stranded RNA virus 1]|nr:RNA-dependent RNA polymerase [Phytophthora condilina negative stranded RNA virus 1]